tara:strand:- start:1112 stop:1219 length:108 start_codon:yes stop_codon:yes gene_type:complete
MDNKAQIADKESVKPELDPESGGGCGFRVYRANHQ